MNVSITVGAVLLRFGHWIESFPHRVYMASVFRRRASGSSMNDRVANLFHRASALLYFIYFLWGCLTIATGLPSLIQTNGEQWQTFFSMAITAVCLPAAVGAAFWPAFARLELWMSSSFIGLCSIYVGILFFFSGVSASPVLTSSVLVVPVFRAIIIVIFLLEQAEERKKAMAVAVASKEK